MKKNITRRGAFQTILLSAGAVAAGKLSPPEAKASAPIAGGCVIMVIGILAAVGIKVFVKRCNVVFKFACNPAVGTPHCHGATEQWWKTHPEIKSLSPGFKLAEDCDAYWSTNSPPPNWCLPPQSGNNPKYVNLQTPEPMFISEAYYDDSEEYGLLPEYVTLQKCTNGQPQNNDSWVDVGTVFIENRYETEPIEIATFQPEDVKALLRVRFA